MHDSIGVFYDSLNMYYFKGACFATLKNKTHIFSIDFTKSNIMLNSQHITLDKMTRLRRMKKFPAAYGTLNEVVDKNTGKTYQFIYLFTDENSGDRWLVKFEEEKLISMRYMIDC
ncbi:MAG: hypothetical protein K2X86_09725 [Cytophagaceae bacterium]|nr:hypothetical protein [Cytophagaceae bacterium]